ncbi:MAG: malonyl-CoA decarboxylase [Telmatospirillum sp.]|nr:malonyl-CoA decarboxylase [Telmatospirillum sp.]
MDEGRLAGLVTQAANSSLFDRLRGVWRDIAQSLGKTGRIDPDLGAEGLPLLRSQVLECLEGRGGEVSARAHAAALGRSYMALTVDGRQRFLKMLADDFGTDPGRVDDAMDAVRSAKADGERSLAEHALRDALVSPRQMLLTQFNALPEGVKFLVDMRAELLPLTKADPAMKALEGDLKELLSSWFDVGFLELHRITWRSPAIILEKIMAYEAVHAIQGWADLKNRLDSDRRLYAFFHPRMPDEPLIFVEVALVEGIAGNIHALLDQHAPVGDPGKADTAIFYSINNAQKGLVGISFGNFLIKKVVDSLSHEFPNLKTFATLSPIPGFRSWLDGRLKDGEQGLVLSAETKSLASVPDGDGTLAGALKTRWHEDPQASLALKPVLSRLCAHYLGEKRADGRRARDPVAHFHLSNGARMERLNWLADTSDKGIAQSAGMMINYLYKLSEIDSNHEAYSGQGKVAMSSSLRSLSKG